MKNVLKKLTLFLILLVLVDYSIGIVLRDLYFKTPRKITHSILESREDIQIYGSSKANRHYNSQVFEDEMGLSCYNNGLDGRNIFYHYAVFQSLIERHEPKLVIIDLLTVDYSESNSDWDTDRLNVLLPFYDENRFINEVINLRSPFEKIKLFSSIYPFNSAIIDIFKTFHRKKGESIGYKGYIPLNEANKPEGKIKRIQFKEPSKPDLAKISFLKKIITTCKLKNIKLIMIKSPWYSENPENSEVLTQLATEEQIPFWNFSYFEPLSNESFFSDPSHLNEKGANLFSSFLAKRIKSELIYNE